MMQVVGLERLWLTSRSFSPAVIRESGDFSFPGSRKFSRHFRVALLVFRVNLKPTCAFFSYASLVR